MAWARIDDAFDDHPKVLSLLDMDSGGAAVGLWTLCLAWAHRNTRRKGKVAGLLPGSLPRRYLGSEGKALAALLVQVGLWDESEDGGWFIHDFDEYLPGDETRAARSAAGKKGAAKRWGGRQEATASETDGKLPSSNDNLPSGGHEGAGNVTANDGSHAGAHRVIPNGITPTPTPTPLPPSAGTATPRRDPAKPINAGDVVGAYVEGAREGKQPHPAETLRKRIGKQAGQLLKEKTAPEVLLAAARNAGACGWADLAVQIQRDAAAAKGRDSPRHQPHSGAHIDPNATYSEDPKDVFGT